MADEISVEVKGADQLREGSEDLAERIGVEAERDFEDVGNKAADLVRSRVPRVSGTLAASVVGFRRERLAVVGIGGPDAPYAGWIEFGGQRRGREGGIAERPYIPQGRYLYPVALAAEPALVAAGTKAADDEIRSFQWENPK